MTKSEFIIKLAEKNKLLTESETEIGVNLLLQTIMKTLASDERVEVRGFGSFGTLFVAGSRRGEYMFSFWVENLEHIKGDAPIVIIIIIKC